ncbi:hypothetical protein QI080_08065 [Staphylococcus saprophyticus]|nr:hypothetical protein [Staphylococcus saprophyticus]
MNNFWKLAYKSVKEQRDQHKVELQQRKSELYYYRDELESYKTNLKQRKEALEYTRDEVKKFKAENEKLRERNKKLEKRCNQKVRRNVRGGLQQMKIEDLESKCDGMKTENEQYKAERDTLIDDLSWYKAKVSRLERQNDEQLALLKEFRKLIDYKLSLHQGSSMYREYRSKLDQLGVK